LTRFWLKNFFAFPFSVPDISICPTRVVNISGSQIIQSPGYPGEYEFGLDCELTVSVPEYSIVELTVEGEYNIPAATSFQTVECHDSHFLLVKFSSSKITNMCGNKTNGDVIDTYFNGGTFKEAILQFNSSNTSENFGSNYKFSIRYSGICDLYY